MVGHGHQFLLETNPADSYRTWVADVSTWAAGHAWSRNSCWKTDRGNWRRSLAHCRKATASSGHPLDLGLDQSQSRWLTCTFAQLLYSSVRKRPDTLLFGDTSPSDHREPR